MPLSPRARAGARGEKLACQNQTANEGHVVSRLQNMTGPAPIGEVGVSVGEFLFSDVRALFKKVTTRLLATYSLTPG
jgi:hypothetical protein